MADYKKLKKIVDSYMEKAPGVSDYCNRCLKTEKWSKSLVLMILREENVAGSFLKKETWQKVLERNR
jgi:hypothetical protein